MFTFIRGVKPRKQPYDFAMILGGMTPEAKVAGASWDNINLADATNGEVQAMAAHYIAFHRHLILRPDMVALLEHSATMANFRALELARDNTKKSKVLCSNMSHNSISKACHSLGLEPIVLDANPENNFQVDQENLNQALDNHERELAAIVSTYGTTQLGHIELLAENEKVQELRKKGVCLHVDAAYGAYIGNLSRHIQRVIPPADSVTIDSYKFIGKPGLALLVLERDKKPTPTVPYYNQSPFTIHSTLSAGPLAAWQQTINDVNIVKLADSSVELAKRCADDLTRLGVPLIEYPQMSIVPIRLKDQKQVKNIENHLLQEGYKVGLVRIEGKDYTINGIRIVITPKIDPELMYGSSSRLVNLIGEYFSKA